MKNRKIVITGASKGIGKAIAKKFAQYDCEIYLISSNEKTLQDASKEINKNNNSKIYYFATNLKTEQGCNDVIADIQNNFKDLDTIIFSAGDTKSGDFLSQPINDFFDGFDLKFYSVVRLLKGLWIHWVLTRLMTLQTTMRFKKTSLSFQLCSLIKIFGTILV